MLTIRFGAPSALVVALAACSPAAEIATSDAGESVCQPNAVIACTCADGASGTGKCNALGTQFGECACAPEGADAGKHDSGSGRTLDSGSDANGHPCDGSACQAVTLATGVVASLAADDTSIYWTTAIDGTVKKMPLAGGAITTLASGQGDPNNIAVGPAGVVWANLQGASPSISIVPVSGGTVTTLASLSETSGGVEGLTIDDTNAYWVEFGAVMKVPLAGGAPTTLWSYTLTGTQFGSVYGMAVDGPTLYWTSGTFSGSSAPCILSVPVSGGSTATVVTTSEALAPGAALTTHGGNLYWTGGAVGSVPASGGAATSIAPLGSDDAYGIATDDEYVYWTDSAGWIARAPLAGAAGDFTVLEGSNGTVRPIVVTATSIYWGTDQGLFKLAK